jgi:DNA-binding MarR family transcriptional regulator
MIVETGTDDDLAMRLRIAVSRLARRMRQNVASLTSAETTVLATVARRGPIVTGDLALYEGMNPTMLSRVVNGLEAGGFVSRRELEGDRRVTLVEATALGRALHDRNRNETSAVLEGALAALSPRDRAALIEALPALEAAAEALRTDRGETLPRGSGQRGAR